MNFPYEAIRSYYRRWYRPDLQGIVIVGDVNVDEMEQKIRRVKHAINVFNTTHTVPGFDLTIDEMLVLIPQLTKRKNKLAEMKEKLPKTREQTYGKSNIVDYRYINYDSNEAASEYEKAAELLSRAQTALDTVNNTETLEIPG